MRRREFITLMSSAAVWPLAARAQQAAMPMIGFLSSRSPGDSAGNVAAFRQGLGASGFVEEQNVMIAFRGEEGHYARLREGPPDGKGGNPAPARPGLTKPAALPG